jgi:hypothetical protein
MIGDNLVNELIPYRVGGEFSAYGYCDMNKRIVLDCIYSQASTFKDGIARVSLAEDRYRKYGLIDTSGNQITYFIFSAICPFNDGLAAVKGGNNLWGFINIDGLLVIPCTYLEVGDFSEGLAPVVVEEEGWGYINKDGRMCIKPIYDYAQSFSEGLAVIFLNGKGGYIDRNGKNIILPIYTKCNSFFEGLAGVEIDGSWGAVNINGKLVIDSIYSPTFYEPFNEHNLGGQDCQIEEGLIFSEGLAAVCYKGKFGYVNSQGKEVIPFMYENATKFCGGLAAVQLRIRTSRRNLSYWGFVDKQNITVIPFSYTQVKRELWGGVFSEGLAYVQAFDKCGYIDKEGIEYFNNTRASSASKLFTTKQSNDELPF